MIRSEGLSETLRSSFLLPILKRWSDIKGCQGHTLPDSRMPRTRNDIINFLMDIGYSFLYNFIEANLCLYGFDVYKGVYHKLFYERKSLACDLVEPFRCIIDKKIRKMHNLGQINEQDFKFKNGEYTIEWEKQKKYIQNFLSALLEQKMQLFSYVKEYYRYCMDPSREFPAFTFVEK